MYLFHEPTLIQQAKHFKFQMIRLDLNLGKPRNIILRLVDLFIPDAISLDFDASSITKRELQVVYLEEMNRIKADQIRQFELSYKMHIQAFYEQVEPQFHQMGFVYHSSTESKRFTIFGQSHYQHVHFDFPPISADSWYDFKNPSELFHIYFHPESKSYDLFSFLEQASELRKTHGRKRGLAKEWERFIGPLRQIEAIYKQTLLQIEQDTGSPMAFLYEKHPKSAF